MATRVQNSGFDIITNRISGAGTSPKYVGWGTGTGQAAAATALATAAAESRTSGTESRTTTTVANDTYKVTGTMTCAGAGKTISEVGLFDASTSGNLFVYSDFTGVALSIGESIQFEISVAFA